MYNSKVFQLVLENFQDRKDTKSKRIVKSFAKAKTDVAKAMIVTSTLNKFNKSLKVSVKNKLESIANNCVYYCGKLIGTTTDRITIEFSDSIEGRYAEGLLETHHDFSILKRKNKVGYKLYIPHESHFKNFNNHKF